MEPEDDLAATDDALIEECRLRSLRLLHDNLTAHGILAATPGQQADARRYNTVFTRDAAICAIGMTLSGDAELASGAARGLVTVADHQARNGQIPNFVDPQENTADFWYLGCIDATLWWLIALRFLDSALPGSDLTIRLDAEVRAALEWLGCREHPHFALLEQNEASDWADIMPRSGYVLYSNALWYRVKCLFGLPDADVTRASFNQLLFPFAGSHPDDRRRELLARYARERARRRDLYLSFLNFSFWGEEGDTFGNLLAILFGLADETTAQRIFSALEREGVHEPYPARAVCEPITRHDTLWRPYMDRHQQNLDWQYHNGGIWPFIGGFWVTALAASGERERARADLTRLARANRLNQWEFNEWLHGQSALPSGMPHQSWNAAAFLIAQRALTGRVFDLAPRTPGP
jgi:Alkaline and neutral invertase